VGIVWSPRTGPGETYAKRHLVPFGEYIPLRDALRPYITRLEQVGTDKVPGTEPGVLEMNGVTLGDVICFEIAYDDVVHQAVPPGTQMLVVQTNNATYMGTGQVEQQFAISRLRAIGTGRPVVVAATNGVSGVIAPTGEVVSRAPVRAPAVVVETVFAVGRPPGLTVGRWLEVVLVGISAIGTVAGLFLGYRRRPLPAGRDTVEHT
jgi:apolipoprotein N-acyltransferase